MSVKELEEANARAFRFACRWDEALAAYERAARTLQHLGYIDNGGAYWKPPLGRDLPPPFPTK